MSSYLYLIVALIAAAGLIAFMGKNAAVLTRPGKDRTALELGCTIGIILVGAFAIYGAFLTESTYFAYLDVGTDTLNQYIPFYLDLLDDIRQGTLSEWNFEYGIGMCSLGYMSWVFDPFNLVLVPLGLLLGSQHLSAILAFIQILKMLLCGILFNRLLCSFCDTAMARIVGAVLYAFCGFLSLWGQHYWLGTVPVMFTALLLAAEKLLERWTVARFLCVTAIAGVSMGWSPYCGFMVLLGTAIIELLLIIGRTSGEKAVRRGAQKVLTLAVPVFCGLLLACVTMIPYATFLFTETSRITSEESMSTGAKAALYTSEFVPLSWVPYILSRLLGTSLISAGADIPADLVPPTPSFEYVNCYEMIVLGFSVAAIIVLLQFYHWALTELSRKGKVLVCVATLLVGLYCFNNFLPALFNALAEPKYRSCFVVAPAVCLALALGWEKRIQVQKTAGIPLAIGAVLTFAILAWSFANTVNSRLLCALYLALAVAFVALLVASKKARAELAPLASLALAIIMTMSTVADGFIDTNKRITCTQDTFPMATEPNMATDTQAAISTLRAEDPQFFRLEKNYSDFTRLNDSWVEGFSGVTVYNSTNDGDVLDFYHAVLPDILPNGSAYQMYQLDMDNKQINDLLGVKYYLSKTPLSLESFEFYKQEGPIYIYRNKDACPLSGHVSTLSESAFSTMTIEERREALQQYVIVPDEKASTSSQGAPETLTVNNIQLTPHEDGLTATVEASQDMVACLTMVNTNGWEIALDGTPVSTFRADLGFIGFNVPQGTHTVEARYVPAGRTTGALLTGVGVAATIAACAIYWLLARRKRQVGPAQDTPSDAPRLGR